MKRYLDRDLLPHILSWQPIHHLQLLGSWKRMLQNLFCRSNKRHSSVDISGWKKKYTRILARAFEMGLSRWRYHGLSFNGLWRPKPLKRQIEYRPENADCRDLWLLDYYYRAVRLLSPENHQPAASRGAECPVKTFCIITIHEHADDKLPRWNLRGG